MWSKKNLDELRLTDNQLKKYRELAYKEELYRETLKKCKVHHTAIEKIISRSDLNMVNPDELSALEENIKETWKDFIIQKGEQR